MIRFRRGGILLFMLFISVGSTLCPASEPEIAVPVEDSQPLPEIVVTARRDLFKVKGPNRFIYEVYKDSALRGAYALDALGKVPLLAVRNNGNVESITGRELIFKINGLKDPVLRSLQQALTSIPADLIKTIEIKEDNSDSGKPVTEVNIITKGRLEGYRAQFSSDITDSNWKNVIWGLSKVKRLTFQGSYFNSWIWGHDSESYKEETRHDNPSLYDFESSSKTSGYKVNTNNVEISASYDTDDRSFISLYGRGLFKINPRLKSDESNRIYDQSGNLSAAYGNSYSRRMRDAEYTASLSYERDLSSDNLPGNLNVGYQFYSRPLTSFSTSLYQIIENNVGEELNLLAILNSNGRREQKYITNTLVADWSKETSRHTKWSVSAKLRSRHESYRNDIEMTPVADNTIRQTDNNKTSLTEYWGNVTPKFAYYVNDKWEVRGGFMLQAYNHRINTSDRPSALNRNRFRILPFLTGAIATGRTMILRLSYNMEDKIPDITALNPYIIRTEAGQITYGNPDLKPQTSHNVSFEISGKTGKLYSGGSIGVSYTGDLSLLYSFMEGEVMHNTYGNIANRRDLSLSGYTSGRLHRNTYVRFSAKIDWLEYRSGLMSQRNSGWTFSCRGYAEQELPWNLTLGISAYYNTPPVLLQGRGSRSFGYDLNLYRQFFNRSLTVGIEADSFLPVWFTSNYSKVGPSFASVSHDRSFHASFSLTLRYVFGKLRTRVKNGSSEFNSSDIKSSYSR